MTYRNHFVKHGQKNTVIYKVWENMKQRCLNPNNPSYHHYGGGGITICERWLSFENFSDDIGDRPTPKHSIDRIDNDGNYEPNNIRWATQTQQTNNQRLRKDNTTGVRGVYFNPRANKPWISCRRINGRDTYKSFSTREEAVSHRQKHNDVTKFIGEYFKGGQN